MHPPWKYTREGHKWEFETRGLLCSPLESFMWYCSLNHVARQPSLSNCESKIKRKRQEPAEQLLVRLKEPQKL